MLFLFLSSLFGLTAFSSSEYIPESKEPFSYTCEIELTDYRGIGGHRYLVNTTEFTLDNKSLEFSAETAKWKNDIRVSYAYKNTPAPAKYNLPDYTKSHEFRTSIPLEGETDLGILVTMRKKLASCMSSKKNYVLALGILGLPWTCG